LSCWHTVLLLPFSRDSFADLLVPFAGCYPDLTRRLLGVCVSEYVHINA
jgi:hypothetical protein